MNSWRIRLMNKSSVRAKLWAEKRRWENRVPSVGAPCLNRPQERGREWYIPYIRVHMFHEDEKWGKKTITHLSMQEEWEKGKALSHSIKSVYKVRGMFVTRHQHMTIDGPVCHTPWWGLDEQGRCVTLLHVRLKDERNDSLVSHPNEHLFYCVSSIHKMCWL